VIAVADVREGENEKQKMERVFFSTLCKVGIEEEVGNNQTPPSLPYRDRSRIKFY
jgi:hypothetical protein